MSNDYEIATKSRALEDYRRGYSVSDSGGWIESVDRSVAAFQRPTKSQTFSSNVGKVLHGYSFKYDTLFWHDNRFKYIPYGAFDASLKSGNVIRMLLEHNDALEFGDSKTNLVLHNDSYGLAFRCHLRDNEVSSHARALAESNAFSECSIGFSYEPHDAEIRTISKTDVLFVNKGSIHEISFVKAGAVKQTHAVIADADKCEPLWSDCRSLKFELDNKYTELQRTLRKLM